MTDQSNTIELTVRCECGFEARGKAAELVSLVQHGVGKRDSPGVAIGADNESSPLQSQFGGPEVLEIVAKMQAVRPGMPVGALAATERGSVASW